MVTYYVIRNKETGWYVKGTPAYYQWSEDPRLFLSIGRLRGFVTSAIKYSKIRRNRTLNLHNWLVDEMVLTTTDTKELHQVVTAKKMMEMLTA